jgi:hypothetical protein
MATLRPEGWPVDHPSDKLGKKDQRMAMTYIDRTAPVVRLLIRPAETAAGDSEQFEILVTLPAEASAASHLQVQDIEDDEPTWQDAEWQ